MLDRNSTAMAPKKPLLGIENLQAWYGDSHVLHGMNLNVAAGEIVTLLGRNGAGKTTTMRAIMGILRARKGGVFINGQQTISMPSNHIAALGVGYCPEERGIFSSLSVEENLLLPPVLRDGGMSIERIEELFPRLKERRDSQGTKLSGGEQQMLAIARILRTGATLLLLDEPTEGLAPVIVQHIGSIIASLKDLGFTVLLVEQNFHFASTIADRHYVVEHGRVVDEIAKADVTHSRDRLQRYLGV